MSVSRNEPNLMPHDDSSKDSSLHAARVTCDQFAALSEWLCYDRVVENLESFCDRKKHKLNPHPNLGLVKRWLVNAWSTEQMLKFMRQEGDSDFHLNAVHWSFPQMYYCVYAGRMAWTTAKGYTDSTHATVIRRYGDDAWNDRLPTRFCIAVDGSASNPRFHGIEQEVYDPHSRLRIDDPRSVAAFLTAFLRTTRELDLKRLRQERRGEFRTIRGGVRQNLMEEHWDKISSRLGPTSVLSILYRKRIKSNYHDVEAFHYDGFEATRLLGDLLTIVNAHGLVAETMIARTIGLKSLEDIIEKAPPGVRGIPKSRWYDLV